MQGMRLKFGEHRSDWKCCFCCHVRTGTIFLGIWHLMLHVLALSVIAVVLRHPEIVDEEVIMDPVLPTPLSEVEEPIVEMINPNLNPNIELSLKPQTEGQILAAGYSASHAYREFFTRRAINRRDLNVGFLVTFCTFVITLFMVFGAVKGKPSYLMPFFCLQVFDFCISSLSAVTYLCYLPDMHRMVAGYSYLPYQEELMRMNPQCLSLLILLTFMVAMMVKAYFIGVVWSCYKYLSLRLVAAQRTIHYIDPDSQSLLHDLPDYETAIGDPRFAMKKFPTPPPSYASATALHTIETAQDPAGTSVPQVHAVQVPERAPAQATNAATMPAPEQRPAA